jgi:hypothetical protein
MANPRNVQYDLLPALGARSRDLLASVVRLGLPRSRNFQPSAETRRHLGSLQTRGYTEAVSLVTPEQVERLVDYFRRQPVWDPWRPHLGDFPWNAVPSPDTNMGQYRPAQIFAAPGVLTIFNDPLVLELAELYLGCKPTLDNVGCWWSYAGRPAAKGTQRFHRDWDNLRGFKLFIYLTDVDEESGPHSYIEGSHRSDLLMEAKAITDEAVYSMFGRAAERLFQGSAGTCFIADTFGIHKGWLPRTRDRLILAAQYNLTPSPLGPQSPVLAHAEQPIDTYVNRLYVDRAH